MKEDKQSNKARRKAPTCSGEREKLYESGAPCQECFEKRRKSHGVTETCHASRSYCRSSRYGCKTCNKIVCKDCWEDFEHGTAVVTEQSPRSSPNRRSPRRSSPRKRIIEAVSSPGSLSKRKRSR